MGFSDKLKEIDRLQDAISSYEKLPSDVLKKINYKFRLEWNYTSNSMEGNTLTKEETRSVMIGNITVEHKPLKDVLEMKGHNDVITEIMRIGQGDKNISESRIREIHKAIMYEEDEEKRKQIGKWKEQDNEIINYKLEKYAFTSHEEVREQMHKLINWLNAEKEKIQGRAKDAMHPVTIALQFHLEYVNIHPFYDGNGRTVRILTNLTLISYGFPPLYIKREETSIYYQYLADIQAYGGSPDVFYDFMAGLLIRSQQLVLDAIEGREIEEPDDLDKKLALLDIELAAIDKDKEIIEQYSPDVFFKIYDSWFSELLKKVIPVIQKFNKYFSGTNHKINIRNGIGSISFTDESPESILKKLYDEILKNKDILKMPYPEISLQTFYGTFKKGGLNTFGCVYGFEIKFDEHKYEVFIDEFSETGRNKHGLYENLLHKPLTTEEIKNIADLLGNTIYNHIEYNIQLKGIR